jgi:hypothetical protein
LVNGGDNVNWDIWAPVLISIPISIVVGLLIDPIKALLHRLAGEGARKRWIKRIEKKTQGYIDFPETFTQYLVVTAIRLLATCSIGFVGLLFMILFGMIAGMSKIANIPISPTDIRAFKEGLTLGVISFDTALVAFTAQTTHCLIWWGLVRSAKNSADR